MSEVRVNNIVDYGGKGAPTFDNGAVISGVSSLGNQAKIGSNVTITSGGINVSGVTTAATLSGNLTGDVSAGFLTATSTVIGSGVTINAGGLNITGVCTATTFEGDGSSMTGVAMTIAPMAYNPDVGDSSTGLQPGIGVTFDHRILAGSGNITLSIATNAGAAGTFVEAFGVGSSVTISGRKLVFTPTSDLTPLETYHVGIPAGAVTNTGGDVSVIATNWTFQARAYNYQLWRWGGENSYGEQGLNDRTQRSSPTQVPGTTWRSIANTMSKNLHNTTTKTDGTLWVWGNNGHGQLGQNNRTYRSSPVQVGTETTWSKSHAQAYKSSMAIKTDGTLWSMGYNTLGRLGDNTTINRSSPVQIPGTTWSTTAGTLTGGGASNAAAIKTDGTLWAWGDNVQGALGINSNVKQSSPTQIPGTTWSKVTSSGDGVYATRTDGTLWSWGYNYHGQLGQNNKTSYSSPTQIPGTTWASVGSSSYAVAAIKTDGTLWAWGRNIHGELGQNSRTYYSSPVQIPGTTWAASTGSTTSFLATKTDGTLWVWGDNAGYGTLGQNAPANSRKSSPTQIPGTDWGTEIYHIGSTWGGFGALKGV